MRVGAPRRATRRRYKFSYGDIGALRGVGAQACRKWFRRNSEPLDRDDFVGNLRKIVEYANDKG